jgi:hypothetical protein
MLKNIFNFLEDVKHSEYFGRADTCTDKNILLSRHTESADISLQKFVCIMRKVEKKSGSFTNAFYIN